ncbi:WD repeat-containing protein on Y chromosome-like [Emydura macquarii macquarii]|uniref:WD repeat-containing protein on Y chromosome-like n=1 Tax=Emydura macquarii macquarii TaxID=1129001 RepID=UPI00352B550C
MAVSDDDSLLCAADHLGYIYIWNITNYALQGPEEEPPALLQSWRAHSCSVTSVTLVSEHQLLLTSSMDCTVRLWSLEGEYVGTFGQKDLWNIKDRMSWRRGSNPNFNPDSCTTPATTTSRAVASEPSCATAGENKANSTEPDRQMTSPLSLIKDNEIAEELKQRQKAKAEQRARPSQLKSIKQEARALTTYHSLQLCELTHVPDTFQKLNPPELTDPGRLAF